MIAETRLKHLLKEAGFPTRGLLERIARETGLARPTVRKFYYNEAAVFSLETVGSICAWLAQNGLGDGLPGTLFAVRPPALMPALMEPGHVAMHVGVYHHLLSTVTRAFQSSWLHNLALSGPRRDSLGPVIDLEPCCISYRARARTSGTSFIGAFTSADTSYASISSAG